MWCGFKGVNKFDVVFDWLVKYDFNMIRLCLLLWLVIEGGKYVILCCCVEVGKEI